MLSRKVEIVPIEGVGGLLHSTPAHCLYRETLDHVSCHYGQIWGSVLRSTAAGYILQTRSYLSRAAGKGEGVG